nr:uncharacterized protein LOC113714088 [Coffea arabica]
MDGNSAAGPDGFSGRFFSAAWEIVGVDVYNAVQSFFFCSELPRRITATSIVLLPKVLRSFGFGKRWIDMVWHVISNVWFFIIVNGSLCGFFKSARGLRQGDPLSAALFIIEAEVLSLSLNQLAHRREFQGFRVPRGCLTITHLGYADDVLIFSSATATSLRLVMRVLDD